VPLPTRPSIKRVVRSGSEHVVRLRIAAVQQSCRPTAARSGPILMPLGFALDCENSSAWLSSQKIRLQLSGKGSLSSVNVMPQRDGALFGMVW